MTTFGPALPPPGSRPVEFMMAHLGVREIAPNRGLWIDECLRFVHLDPAACHPWCAASFVWCAHQGGVPLKRTASVKVLWESVQDRRIEEPEPGCGGIHLRGDGKGHVVYVLQRNPDGSLYTVSGNTNGMGSRNGDRVGLVDHDRDYFVGFFHMRRPGE